MFLSRGGKQTKLLPTSSDVLEQVAPVFVCVSCGAAHISVWTSVCAARSRDPVFADKE